MEAIRNDFKVLCAPLCPHQMRLWPHLSLELGLDFLLPVKCALHQSKEGSVVFLQIGAELLEDGVIHDRVRTSL